MYFTTINKRHQCSGVISAADMDRDWAGNDEGQGPQEESTSGGVQVRPGEGREWSKRGVWG